MTIGHQTILLNITPHIGVFAGDREQLTGLFCARYLMLHIKRDFAGGGLQYVPIVWSDMH